MDTIRLAKAKKIAVFMFEQYSVPMQCKVTINEQGEITIPTSMREVLGPKDSDELIVEVTETGILLRPDFTIPIENYSENRIREFSRDEDQIGQIICQKRD